MEANAESNHGVTRIESGRDREWDGGRRGPAGRTPDVTNATNMLLTAHRSPLTAHRSPLTARCPLLVTRVPVDRPASAGVGAMARGDRRARRRLPRPCGVARCRPRGLRRLTDRTARRCASPRSRT
ncbi:enoyl-CoA hydratase [Burkholderia pseudomallei]|nr:enoyl-CoA hydratase [Burkholderia pseudomallei]NAX60963.1 enoyl-CoA hydratase [Burkholderia pseudomallei]NAX72008.1 enoyl-CoA hydratase [Burkholderia pseudomallei]NAX84511.1 enoyl-CoA hydratase [Burkholderia pseudomallei]NAX87930.1 enoyl-CoA hydratase [Burkholderia pseudomallei]